MKIRKKKINATAIHPHDLLKRLHFTEYYPAWAHLTDYHCFVNHSLKVKARYSQDEADYRIMWMNGAAIYNGSSPENFNRQLLILSGR